MTETLSTVISRSPCDEAIQTASAETFLDCFAEPVIGPRFARTRWLAMTEQEFIGVIPGHAKREPGISLDNLEVPDRTAMRSVRNDAH